jgi:(1->4)-alpha-D-glucan 1-alpha-D-glucosylmutase
MDKALKEAKLHTSWANPDEPYGQAIENFIRSILDPELSGPFLADFDVFVREIADAGWINALSQMVLKIFMPGLPDFYQGTELWDFHLVDPDNRGAVDFDYRRKLLGNLKQSAATNRAALLSELLSRWPDERLKMFLAWQSLECRRRNEAACSVGAYNPLVAEGPKADHICAFARSHEGKSVIVIVPRLVRDAARGVPGMLRLFGPRGSYTAWWKGTALRIPNALIESSGPKRWRRALSGTEFETKPTNNGHHTLNLTELFAICPWAILEGFLEQ